VVRLLTAGAELGLGMASGDGVVTGTVTRDTTVRRTGSASYKCDSGGGNSPASNQWNVAFTLGQAVFARIYFRVDVLPSVAATIMRFSGSAYPTVKIKTNGKFGLFDPSGNQIGSDSAATITAGDGTWFRVEMQLTIGASTADDSAELLVDGTSVASSTGQTWSVTAPTVLNAGWIVSAGVNRILYMDDVAVNDASGASQTGYPGAGSVIALRPASVSAQGGWTIGSGGSIPTALSNAPPQGVADVSTVTSQARSASATADDALSVVTETYASKLPSGSPTVTLVQPYADHGEGAAAGTKNLDLAVTANPSGSTSAAFTAGGDAGAAGTWPTNWRGTYGPAVSSPSVTTSSGGTLTIRDKTTNTNVVLVDQMALMVEYTGGISTTVVGQSLVQKFNVNTLVGASLAQPFSVLTLVTKSLAQPFNVNTILGKSLAQPFTVNQLAGRSLAQPFTVNQLAGASLAQPFVVAQIAGRSLAQPFVVYQLAGRSLAQPFVVAQLAGRSLAQPFLVAQLAGRSLAQPFVVAEAVGRSLAQRFDIAGAVGRSLAQRFDVYEILGVSLAQPFGFNVIVGRSLEQDFLVAETVGLSLAQPFDVLTAVGASLAQPFDINAIVGSSLAQPFDVDVTVGQSLVQVFTIQGAAGLSLVQRFLIEAFLESPLTVEAVGLPGTVERVVDPGVVEFVGLGAMVEA
jgi:hypothetical protein